MKNPIRVLSAADLQGALERAESDYPVEAGFYSGNEGNLVEKIACMQPDVVILPLFMPGQDAIEVMKAYRSLYSDSHTCFAVLCPFVTRSLRQEMMECGVSRIICRPDYLHGLYSLLEEVSQRKATPLALARSAGTHAVHMLHHRRAVPGEDGAELLGGAIDELLEALGLDRSDAGCRYLRRAVMIAAGGECGNASVTKIIYPSVAAQFGTTPSSVERRIRRAIAGAWRSEHSATLAAYFGYTVDNLRGRPSNSEFIFLLADRIRLDLSHQSEMASV